EPPGEPIGHLFVAHEFVASQADAWNHALGELNQFYEEVQHRGDPTPDLLPEGRFTLSDVPTPPAIHELAGAYIDSAHLLGRRTAEMPMALTGDTMSPAFAPEPFTREDVARIVADALAAVKRSQSALQPSVATRLHRRLAGMRAAHGADAIDPASAKIRIHGD